MTDFLIVHEPDGGEVMIENGRVELTDGPESAVYLSLFGGNEEDSGGYGDARKQWWGNLDETDPARCYRSETQYLLKSLPLIPANLRRLEDAAERDLGWMLSATPRIADAISVAATMPALNTVELAIALTINEQTFRTVFSFRRAA